MARVIRGAFVYSTSTVVRRSPYGKVYAHVPLRVWCPYPDDGSSPNAFSTTGFRLTLSEDFLDRRKSRP